MVRTSEATEQDFQLLLETAETLEFSGAFIMDEDMDLQFSQWRWYVPKRTWKPEAHDKKRFAISRTVVGSLFRFPGRDSATITPLVRPDQSKGLFFIDRNITKERNSAGIEIPHKSWLNNELKRYRQAGLRPILVWDHQSPFFNNPRFFYKQKWFVWLPLYDKIAFRSESDAVIAQGLNDIKQQEDRFSGVESGASASPVTQAAGNLSPSGWP